MDVVVMEPWQKLTAQCVQHVLTGEPGQTRRHLPDPAAGQPDVDWTSKPRDFCAADQKRPWLGAGIHEAQVTLARMGDPMVLVDLDVPSEDVGVNMSSSVVVGVSRAPEPPSLAGRDVDVAVTSAPRPPVPWVSCPDVEEELELLAERIRTWPGAALTLVQVLRSSGGLSISKALLIESLAYSALQGGPEFRSWLDDKPATVAKVSTGDPVLVVREGARLTITLNRPEVHNAYDALMRDGLCDALSIAAADPSVHDIHLSGEGPSFCSGGDLNEFGTFADPVSAHLVRTSQSPALLLGRLAGRVTAHLHGSCVGSGIELPAFAGKVLADPASTFRLPEMGMGLIPGAGGTVSISRRIGRRRTGWLVLSGRSIDARTAKAWGLVDELQARGP
jgi:enoyl-CoA hydratase/isomerase-like protein